MTVDQTFAHWTGVATTRNGPMIAEALTSARSEPISSAAIEAGDHSIEVIDSSIEAFDPPIEAADPSIEAADPSIEAADLSTEANPSGTTLESKHA